MFYVLESGPEYRRHPKRCVHAPVLVAVNCNLQSWEDAELSTAFASALLFEFV